MKKSILLLTVLALIASLVGAASAQAGTSKGLKAGLVMSTLTGDDTTVGTVDPGYKMGLAIGGYMNYALSPQFAFQPEVYYAMKGAKYEDGGDKLTMKLNYLSIPLLLKMQTTPESGVFFVAGPEVAFKLSAKANVESGDVSGEMDVSDGIKGLDYGLVVGAGLNLTQFTVEARYSMGLTSFDDTTDPDDIKNSGFMFLVGMGF